jgi:N-acetylneuraminate synthase
MFLPEHSVFIIAEAGVNHNGDPDLAMQLVDIAAKTGANAVKFQTFDAKELVTSTAPKAVYQQASTNGIESQREMLLRLQLDGETHHRLKQRAEERGLVFISTAFDFPSLAFLTNDLDLRVLKIPSGEITNGPLLLEYARSGRDLILSTGMSTLEDVRMALSVLAFGLTGGNVPSAKAFDEAFASQAGQNALLSCVTLLHCTTQYPTPFSSVNLKAMVSLREAFGLKIGYSDHTTGWVVACAAVAQAARVIEKHFTVDKSLPGPDHAASLEPQELRQMVENIRAVETALGDGKKVPQPAELENLPVARKSLVAACAIARGELFSVENLAIKRPGDGCTPMKYWNLIGTLATRDYLPDEQIDK